MKKMWYIMRMFFAVISQLPYTLFFVASSRVTKSIILMDMAQNHNTQINNELPPPTTTIKNYLNSFGLLSLMLLCNQYFKALYMHRIRKNPASRLLWHRHFLFEIPYDVEIGAGMKLDHPFSTIVNAKSIGKNCRIKNNVTIGNKNDNELLRPQIGDNVYIGAGAIIIGAISIGDNSVIGAGTVVTKDVPSDSVVVGNPARIL